MEDRSPFRLEETITKWSLDLASTGLDHGDILELESHLRDEIDALRSGPLDDQEAFHIACRRLGTVDRISQEYAKLGPHSLVVHSVLSGALILLVAYSLAVFFSFLFYCIRPAVSMFELAMLSFAGTIAVTLGLVIYVHRIHNLADRRSIAGLTIVFVIVKLGTYFVNSRDPFTALSHMEFGKILNSIMLSSAGLIFVLLLLIGLLIWKDRRKQASDLIVTC